MAYNKEQVIEMCKAVHGNKYDYSITEGVQNKLGIIRYICPIHGVKEQIFHNHLQGKGCTECANIERKKKHTPTKNEFLVKASKKHNIDEYVWDDFDLLKRDEKGRVEFCCKKHGKYWDWPSNFIKGYGCHICHGKGKDDEEVREELSKLHPELDFTQTKYSERDSKYRIKVICPKHGEQLINYYNLKNGQGCYWCGREATGIKNTIANEEFIKRGIKIYGDEYTYKHLDMENRDEQGKVIVTCKIHGDFKVTPDNFYHGHACPKCKESSLEREIRIFLEENNIKYIYECNKTDLKWLGSQRLDFYLPEYNIAIECQGEQHFMATTFGTKRKTKEECLKEIQKRDALKLGKCMLHGVKVLYYADYDYDFPYKVFIKKETLLKEIKGE